MKIYSINKKNNKNQKNKNKKKVYKYIILFIFISFSFPGKKFYFPFLIYLKVNSTLLDNISDFDFINELNNYKDIEIFLKNKTEFYLKLRSKFLQTKHNVTYNDSEVNTFQEKLNWLVIHESPQYKSLIVDKIKLHDYSRKVLGKDICVPIIKVYNNTKDVNFNELPEQFTLKLNHGSKMNIICNDKSKLNIQKTLKKLNKWKKINYGLQTKEFQYMYVKRKIFAEKYLSDNLIDYKFFCFNHNPRFIKTRRVLKNNTLVFNYYNLNWELMDLETDMEGCIRDPNLKVNKPTNLDLMIKYAKLLSQEFVFVRVDLYEFNNKVYLGELTFTPDNSFLKWKNKTESITFGNLMNLTEIKNYLYNK